MDLFDGIRRRRELRALREQVEIATLKSQLKEVPEWLAATAEARQFEIPSGELAEHQAGLYQRLSWVNAAIEAVANVAAGVPLGVYALDGEERVEVENHPFETLLERPNPLNSRFELLFTSLANRKLTGNCYWWLNRPGPDVPPREIWALPSDRVKPVPDGRLYLKGYMYDPGDGSEMPLEAWEIMHWHGYHPRNPWMGMSAIEALATAAVGDMQAAKWNANFFAKDNAKVPGIIGFADMVNDADWERIKRDWRDQFGGAQNRQLLMLRGLGEGAIKYIPTGLTQSEMQFLAGRQFTKEEIWTVLAPGLAAMLAIDANRANSTNAYATLHALAIWPLLAALAQKITNDILPSYGDNYVAAFEDVRVTDRTMELRERVAYAAVHTIDEIRAHYDGDGPLGDERGQRLPAELRAKWVDGEQESHGTHASERLGVTPMRAALLEPLDTSDCEAAIKAEMGTWYRYAVKRKPEKRDSFKCEHIPADVASVIRERLALAETPEEVKAAFAGPFLIKAERTSPSGVDPNADAKDHWERHIIQLLRGRLKGQFQRVMKLLGWPPDWGRLDDAFWQSELGQMVADLRPAIEQMALMGAEGLIQRQNIGVDWVLVAQNAADWAQRYTFDLVRGVTDTTQRALQRRVAAFIETPGMTREDLEASLRPLFGEARASMIAVSETTRAYAEGERATAAVAQAQGFKLEPRWHTANDELVCSICGPNEGKLHLDGWTVDWPPAHVNCRCWVTHEWLQ